MNKILVVFIVGILLWAGLYVYGDITWDVHCKQDLQDCAKISQEVVDSQENIDTIHDWSVSHEKENSFLRQKEFFEESQLKWELAEEEEREYQIYLREEWKIIVSEYESERQEKLINQSN